MSQHHRGTLGSLVQQPQVLVDELPPVAPGVGQRGVFLRVVVTHHQSVQPCCLLHAPAGFGAGTALLVGARVGHDLRHEDESRQALLLGTIALLVACVQQLAALMDGGLHALRAHYLPEVVAGAWTSGFKES